MTGPSRHCGPPPTPAEIEDAFAWTRDGWCCAYMGDAEKAERLANAARVLAWAILVLRLLPDKTLAAFAEAGVLPEEHRP